MEHTASSVAAGATAAEMLAAERKRVGEIAALASEHNIDATKTNAWIAGGASVEAVSLEILRAKKAEASAQPVTPAATPDVRVGAERETQKPFANFGDFIGAVRNAEVNAYAIDARLKPLAAASGMGVALGADGGFLVPEQFAEGVVKIAFEGGEILSRVTDIPVTGNQYHLNLVDEQSRVNGSRWGGVRGFWIGEGDQATPSRPKFRRHTLDVTKKFAVLAYASAEQLEDAAASSRVIEQAFGEELTFGVEGSIWEGSGTGQPLGFMNSGALITQAAEAGQTAGTIVAANLTKMYARLLRSARRNAVWFINQDAEPQLPLMTIGNQPVYLPPGGLSGNQYGTLFGRPVIPVEFASTIGQVGDIVLASLDWYALGTKNRGQMARSMHVRFLQDEEAFRMTFRCDGSPMLSQPITPLKGNNTQSAFVALAAR